MNDPGVFGGLDGEGKRIEHQTLPSVGELVAMGRNERLDEWNRRCGAKKLSGSVEPDQVK